MKRACIKQRYKALNANTQVHIYPTWRFQELEIEFAYTCAVVNGCFNNYIDMMLDGFSFRNHFGVTEDCNLHQRIVFLSENFEGNQSKRYLCCL